MMFMTDRIAKGLHDRFNEQNEILNRMDGSLDKIMSSQKDMVSTLKSIDGKLEPKLQNFFLTEPYSPNP